MQSLPAPSAEGCVVSSLGDVLKEEAAEAFLAPVCALLHTSVATSYVRARRVRSVHVCLCARATMLTHLISECLLQQ